MDDFPSIFFYSDLSFPIPEYWRLWNDRINYRKSHEQILQSMNIALTLRCKFKEFLKILCWKQC